MFKRILGCTLVLADLSTHAFASTTVRESAVGSTQAIYVDLKIRKACVLPVDPAGPIAFSIEAPSQQQGPDQGAEVTQLAQVVQQTDIDLSNLEPCTSQTVELAAQIAPSRTRVAGWPLTIAVTAGYLGTCRYGVYDDFFRNSILSPQPYHKKWSQMRRRFDGEIGVGFDATDWDSPLGRAFQHGARTNSGSITAATNTLIAACTPATLVNAGAIDYTWFLSTGFAGLVMYMFGK